MRWFVEITSFGQSPAPSVTFCVEAPQWQPALQKTRALRGDAGALSNFSIELLEEGYRAIDPVTRLRYMIRRAPDDAPLSGGEAPVAAPAAPAWPAVPAEPKKQRAATLMFSSKGMAAIREEPAPPAAYAVGAAPRGEAAPPMPATAPAPVVAAVPAAAAAAAAVSAPVPVPVLASASASVSAFASTPAVAAVPVVDKPLHGVPADANVDRASPLPPFELLSKREDNPSERSPLTYREHVYTVAEGTPVDAARRLLLDRFEDVRRTLNQDFTGKLINLAVFDHIFQGKPLRRPIATLTWKDWKSPDPEIRFPALDSSREPPASVEARSQASPNAPGALATASPPAVEPAPAATLTPAPALVATAAAPSVALPSGASSLQSSSSTPVPSPALASSSPPTSSSTTPSSKPPSLRHLSGEELMAELFNACGDLRFLHDPYDGADFILALVLDTVPSEVGLLSLFDARKREYVVVRQTGGQGSAVLSKLPERAILAQSVMRSKRAVVLPDAVGDPRAEGERWKLIGTEPRSLICAPVDVPGRPLGLIEVINPRDGSSYTDGDGSALTYIGKQFAEYIAAREVVLDPERVSRDAQKAHRR